MIGAKSQLKWFWRSVAPVVVLFVTLKVESASARFVTDPQTTPKPCVRLQRKAVWKRARKIAIMVYGSNCLFGSRFPRRAQPSHAGDALKPVRLLGSYPCRGADENLRTIGGGGANVPAARAGGMQDLAPVRRLHARQDRREPSAARMTVYGPPPDGQESSGGPAPCMRRPELRPEVREQHDPAPPI